MESTKGKWIAIACFFYFALHHTSATPMVGTCTLKEHLKEDGNCARTFFSSFRSDNDLHCGARYDKMVECQLTSFFKCFKDVLQADILQIVLMNIESGYRSNDMENVLCEGKPFHIKRPETDPGKSQCVKHYYEEANANAKKFLTFFHQHKGSKRLCRRFNLLQTKLRQLEHVYCEDGSLGVVRPRLGWLFSHTQNPFC